MKKLMVLAALALVGCGSESSSPSSGNPGGGGYRSVVDPTAPDVNPVGSAPSTNLMNHAQDAVNKIQVPQANFEDPK